MSRARILIADDHALIRSGLRVLLQRDAEEAVFIDDRVENVAAAAALGMHAIRYESSAQLADALNRLGVPVEQAGSDRLLLHEA